MKLHSPLYHQASLTSKRGCHSVQQGFFEILSNTMPRNTRKTLGVTSSSGLLQNTPSVRDLQRECYEIKAHT